MIIVIQRVLRASVKTDSINNSIKKGLVVLFGAASSDSKEDVSVLAKKTIDLRIFGDDEGKMNLSSIDACAEILVVSQFTLLANCKKGNRPSFINAARPDVGRLLYEEYIEQIKKLV